MPEGLLSGKGGVRIHKLMVAKDAETNLATDYLVVAGNRDTFTPQTSLSGKGRWVGPQEFKFGHLPENSPDVDDLRHVYTGSMNMSDLAGLMLGIQTVRALRHPEYPLVIGSSNLPMNVALRSPEAFVLSFSEEFDRKLPPLHLPPGLNAKPNKPFSATRRQVLRMAARATFVASKLPMLPKGALEAMARQLLLSGAQAKPL